MSENALVVEGLRRRFGGVAAMDGIDREVSPGAMFGRLGPNGAGRTTTIRMRAGHLSRSGRLDGSRPLRITSHYRLRTAQCAR